MDTTGAGDPHQVHEHLLAFGTCLVHPFVTTSAGEPAKVEHVDDEQAGAQPTRQVDGSRDGSRGDVREVGGEHDGAHVRPGRPAR